MKRKSDWERIGELYAQEDPLVVQKPHATEPPPHATDFYRGVLVVLNSNTSNWLFSVPADHPFWLGLCAQLEAGSMKWNEIKSAQVVVRLAQMDDQEFIRVPSSRITEREKPITEVIRSVGAETVRLAHHAHA